MAVNGTEAVSQTLIQLSDKLGYSVSKLYEIYTQGQAVEGMLGVASIVFVVLVGIAAFWYTNRRFSEYEGEKTVTSYSSERTWDKGDTLGYSIVAGLMSALLAAFVVAAAQPALLKVLAPEYMAAKELVETAGGVVG